jgi:c-di-GMP-binding flagellar brake protein YcgR
MQQPQTPPRRYPRAKIGFEIRVQVEHRATSTRTDGRLTVLGAGGAFLVLGRDYPVGSLLRVQFRLPSVDDEIACTAVVRNGVVGQGLGVEFIDISLRDQGQVATFVAQLTLPESVACPNCGEQVKKDAISPDSGHACLHCAHCGYLWESIQGSSALYRILATTEIAKPLPERKPPHGVERAPRYGAQLTVRYHGARETDWHKATTENLSETGVLFRTTDHHSSETSLVIVFDTGDVRVGCRGEIVRTAKTGEQWTVAARFSDCYLTPS